MLIVNTHAALVGEAMSLHTALLSTTTFAGCRTTGGAAALLFVFIVLIALTNSVAISFFVMSVPCVVSTLALAGWFMIFALTLTGMVLLTVPFAITIALSILLKIAFLITGSSCFIIPKLLPCIEFVV